MSIRNALFETCGTRINKQQSDAVFGEGNFEGFLAIPKLIDLYNSYLNGVDCFDQTRAHWHIQREHIKSWKALFSWCLDVAVINAYKLSASGQKDYPNTRAATQLTFRRLLYMQLFEQSEHNYVKKSLNLPPYIDCIKAVEPTRHCLYKSHSLAICKSCSFLGRTAARVAKRKALEDLGPNTTRHGQRRAQARRTRFKCERCGLPIREQCERDHRAAVLRKIDCI